jgi:hypothetical protein
MVMINPGPLGSIMIPPDVGPELEKLSAIFSSSGPCLFREPMFSMPVISCRTGLVSGVLPSRPTR